MMASFTNSDPKHPASPSPIHQQLHIKSLNVLRHQQHQITSHHINHGVPQGSYISPILFILYVSDLPSPTHEYKVSRSQFGRHLRLHLRQTNSINPTTTTKLNQPNHNIQWCLQNRTKCRQSGTDIFPWQTPHLREKQQTDHNQQHKHTNSQQSKSHLRFITIIHNAHQINRLILLSPKIYS